MSDMNSRDSFEYLSEDEQDYTLESILAEFKGSAYIAGDKKTSPNLLDERIRRIVKESQEGDVAENELYNIKANDNFFEDISVPYGEEDITLTEDDKKLAARTAEIDWQPVKAATSFDEVRNEAAAFFAKRDEAVGKRQEEILREKKEEARRKAEEEARKAAEAQEVEEIQEDLNDESAEEERAKSFEELRFSSEDDLLNESVIEAEENETGKDPEILFFDNYRFADSKSDEAYADFDDYDEYDTEEADEQKKESFLARIFKRGKNNNESDDDTPENIESAETEVEPEPEIYIEEPDFASEAMRLTKIRNKLMLKSRIALFVAVIMGVMTVLFDKGIGIIGIGDDITLFTAAMLVMQLIVMALSNEIISRGLADIFKREIGAETLVLFSNLATYIGACVSVLNGGDGFGAPYCAVSSFACAFSLWGEYRQIAAMSLSLKTAVSTDTPQILTGQYLKDIDTSLIRKYYCSAEGFYNKLVDMDIAEHTYKLFAPLIIFAAILLSIVMAVGNNSNFIYALSAVAAAAGSFSAMSAFAVPFSRAAKKLRKSGSAIAGWGGSDDIYFADGIRLTDGDIFPGGVQVSGPTALENMKPDKILRYSASLMIASNSGLSKGFEDLLTKQGIAMVGVENFECYEGGYAAVIRGERIVCGSAACMALLGLRIPQSVNSKNVIFAAINDTVVGTFNVTYKPSKNVQASLLSLLRAKVKLYFAVRDFNITPLMVQQKLQIPVDEIEYLPCVQAYRLTDDEPEGIPSASAVIARNTPVIYAETVTTAKGLRSISVINTALSLITAIFGIIIVFLLSWSSSGTLIKPSNLMEYMLAVQLATILLSNIIGIA